jgi:hypothetical protein
MISQYSIGFVFFRWGGSRQAALPTAFDLERIFLGGWRER